MLLAVGSIVPRKAYDVLVRALACVRSRDWRLAIVGPTDRSAQAFTALQAAIEETGLAAAHRAHRRGRPGAAGQIL